MKKIVSLFLCMVFIFSLSACSSKEKEEECKRIALTKDNYSKYININIYFTDFSFAVSKQTQSTVFSKTELIAEEYALSVVVHIETSKKVECTFENVSIAYTPHLILSSFWNDSYSSRPTTTLNLEGESHISYIATRERTSIDDALTTPSTKALIGSIQGYVLVPTDK